MGGCRIELLGFFFAVHVDIQATDMIGNVRALVQDLSELAGPQPPCPWVNVRVIDKIVIKNNFGINVAFGEFGESGVALGTCIECDKV